MMVDLKYKNGLVVDTEKNKIQVEISIEENKLFISLYQLDDNEPFDIHEYDLDKYKLLCGECGKELTQENKYSDYTCMECAKEIGLEE